MAKISDIDAQDIFATAAELAEAAREATLQHFRSEGLTADNKEAARFDPVTVADRLSETRMREILARRRPADGILGEEFGPGEAEFFDNRVNFARSDDGRHGRDHKKNGGDRNKSS